MSTFVNAPNLSSGGTIVLVAKQSSGDGATNFDALGTFIGAGNERDLLITRGSTTDGSLASIEGGIDTDTVVDSDPVIPENTFVTIFLRYDGTTIKLSINGGAESTLLADGLGYIATPLTLFKALAGAQGNKQIAEAVIYSRYVDDTEKGQLETYLQETYNHY